MLAIGLRRALALGAAAASLTCFLLPSIADARQRYTRERERPQPTAEPAIRKPDGPSTSSSRSAASACGSTTSTGSSTTSIVSTGTAGFPTPAGVFAILDKEVQHYSNIYGGASMPYMQRLTMSGVALHSGVTTGRPASHGCIRLPHAFARHLFGLTGLGARVIIAPNEPVPRRSPTPTCSRGSRSRPLPPTTSTRASRGVAAKAGGFDVQKGAATAGVGKITAWRTGVLQALPISVFVSKAEGKVYVRHGFRRLFEAPVEIRNSDRPIGTHVFTALEFKDDGTSMRWISVSVPASGEVAQTRRVSRASRNESEPMLPRSSGPPSTAAEALARIELPKEARDRISQMLSPGVVADRLRSRPQPRDARQRHHRFRRADALSAIRAVASALRSSRDPDIHVDWVPACPCSQAVACARRRHDVSQRPFPAGELDQRASSTPSSPALQVSFAPCTSSSRRARITRRLACGAGNEVRPLAADLALSLAGEALGLRPHPRRTSISRLRRPPSRLPVTSTVLPASEVPHRLAQEMLQRLHRRAPLAQDVAGRAGGQRQPRLGRPGSWAWRPAMHRAAASRQRAARACRLAGRPSAPSSPR